MSIFLSLIKFMRVNQALSTAAICFFAAIFGLCSVLFFHKKDNIVEQVAETVIESELGLPKGTVDLTP
jgi:hypothetical protein